MRKAALVLTAVAGSLVFGLTGASGGAEQAPGVTSKVVKIGGTFPLSGPAASYAPIARGLQAYFSYENATKRGADKARGCGGRQVQFIVYDDIFNPPQTVTQTIRLVDQDKVFATLGGLGTEPQQAVRPYLNKNEVPQLYVSTGATKWGAAPEGLEVDAGLAARLPGRRRDLRAAHQEQHAEREDRDPLPERRLRQGLHRGSRGRPRPQEESDRARRAATTSPTRRSRRSCSHCGRRVRTR